jgi:hypothetical protein
MQINQVQAHRHAAEEATMAQSNAGDLRMGAAPAWDAIAARQRDFEQIQTGWSVFSSDGEQLGQVSQIGAGWFAVPYGERDELTMYLPIEYVETAINQRVVVNQPAGLLFDMKLFQPPEVLPAERIELSGVPHDPRRGEPGHAVSATEPLDSPG